MPTSKLTAALVGSISSLLVATAACGSPDSQSQKSTLSGRAFVAVSADGFELPTGSALQLVFDGFALRLSGGCNTGTADYDLVDGVLIVESLGMTEMACTPPLMELDDTVVGLLVGRPTVRLDGDALTLAAGGNTLRLVERQAPAPGRALEGTLWIVESVVNGDATTGGFGGATATVRFVNGIAEVNGGCNTGSAPADIGEGVIQFGALGLTRMACEQPAMELEYSVAIVLQGPVSYSIEADTLTLQNGSWGLVLRAAAAG